MSLENRIAALEAENAALRRRLAVAGPGTDASPSATSAAPEVIAVLHRARNTLAMVRAIVRRASDVARSAEDCVMRLDGRLGAIARVQSTDMADPSAGIDLHSILADELLAVLAREGEQVHLAGPKVLLAPRAAEVFALTAHELADNAMEHGALTRPGGRIGVTWILTPGAAAPVLSLAWTETGMHDLPGEPSRRGFGTEMLEHTLRYEFAAVSAVVYAPDGLRCTIRFPLSPRIGVAPEASPRDDGSASERAVSF